MLNNFATTVQNFVTKF